MREQERDLGLARRAQICPAHAAERGGGYAVGAREDGRELERTADRLVVLVLGSSRRAMTRMHHAPEMTVTNPPQSQSQGESAYENSQACATATVSWLMAFARPLKIPILRGLELERVTVSLLAVPFCLS